MKYGFLTLLLVAVLASVTAFAQGYTAPEIRQAEQYLSSLKTVKARFVQKSNGMQATGTFYLSRPGKLRFEYDPPIEDFVVADGAFIYFYDSELEQQTNAPIGQTLADFILRDNIKLSGDVKVEGVSHSPNLINIKVIQKNDPQAGAITLGFSKEPYQLKKWTVTDAQGIQTEIDLFDVQSNVALVPTLFRYIAPKPKGFNN